MAADEQTEDDEDDEDAIGARSLMEFQRAGDDAERIAAAEQARRDRRQNKSIRTVKQLVQAAQADMRRFRDQLEGQGADVQKARRTLYGYTDDGGQRHRGLVDTVSELAEQLRGHDVVLHGPKEGRDPNEPRGVLGDMNRLRLWLKIAAAGGAGGIAPDVAQLLMGG